MDELEAAMCGMFSFFLFLWFAALFACKWLVVWQSHNFVEAIEERGTEEVVDHNLAIADHNLAIILVYLVTSLPANY